MVMGMVKGCDNCIHSGRPSYEWPCTVCETAYGSAPSKWESMVPATADMVEVVRCKDCKYWKPGDSFGGDSLDDMQRIGGCPIMRFGRREKDFCCDGERKDNG